MGQHSHVVQPVIEWCDVLWNPCIRGTSQLAVGGKVAGTASDLGAC